MPNKNQIKLPMRSGDFVDLQTNEKGERIAHFILSVEDHEFDDPNTSGLRFVEPRGMYVELKELEKRFRKDGDIYTLMSDFQQGVDDKPLTQEEFDEEMAKADGIATVFDLIQGTLPDGYWFVLEYCSGLPKNKTAAREVRAFGVSANLSLKRLYELDQSFTLADVRILEWLFTIHDSEAWGEQYGSLDIDDPEDREWLFSTILSLEEMYKDYSNGGLDRCCSRGDFASAVGETMFLEGLDLVDIENDPTPVYRYLESLK